MSRYRTIHCLVWQDDKFPFAGDDIQLLWFHLKTTPLSTPLGIFYAPVAGLAAEKRWSEERYRKRLMEGSEKGFWKVDERSHVVYFPNFLRYNKPDNPNVFRGWLKCWDEIPECSLKGECYQQLKKYCEEWGEGFAKVLETLGERSANVRETGTGTVTGTVTGTFLSERLAPSDEKQSLGQQPEEPVFIKIPLIDKTEFPVIQRQVDEWKSLYLAVDVEQELRNYLGWAIANPKKRKTRKGILASVNSWLQDKQNKPRRGTPTEPSIAYPRRDTHEKNLDTFKRFVGKNGNERSG